MRLLPFLIFVIVVVLLLLPTLRRLRSPARPLPTTVRDELVKDPVCQTYIVKSRAVRRLDAGHIRYFCSEQCARLGTGT